MLATEKSPLSFEDQMRAAKTTLDGNITALTKQYEKINASIKIGNAILQCLWKDKKTSPDEKVLIASECLENLNNMRTSYQSITQLATDTFQFLTECKKKFNSPESFQDPPFTLDHIKERLNQEQSLYTFISQYNARGSSDS